MLEELGAPGTSPSAGGHASTTGQPRLVRRVVCGYRTESLPGEWLQTWRRLDRLMQRSGFDVKVTLDPLEALPADTDILVVPPELRQDAYAVLAPGVPLLVTPAAAAAGAFADMVRRLEAGTELFAERLDPLEEANKPRLVTYRGQTRLD